MNWKISWSSRTCQSSIYDFFIASRVIGNIIKEYSLPVSCCYTINTFVMFSYEYILAINSPVQPLASDSAIKAPVEVPANKSVLAKRFGLLSQSLFSNLVESAPLTPPPSNEIILKVDNTRVLLKIYLKLIYAKVINIVIQI